jgi:hypothetical protein
MLAAEVIKSNLPDTIVFASGIFALVAACLWLPRFVERFEKPRDWVAEFRQRQEAAEEDS